MSGERDGDSKPELLICLDGEFVPKSEAKVSVFDHGLLYGDGVFEGIRAYNGRVFRLDEHVRRLYESAHTIGLTMPPVNPAVSDQPMTREEFAQQIVATCLQNKLTDGYIRAVVTRGVGDLGLDPQKCPRASYFIIAAQIQLYPEALYEQGLSVITCATRRNAPTALDPAIKSLNYLNNILAKIEVTRVGAGEGLMLNQQGFVSEATGDNIFVLRDGALYTPPAGAGCLRGITREAVIELAKQARIEVREEFFTLQFVYNADECFLTGTAAEVIAVVDVDGRAIGTGKPGAKTQQLNRAFREMVASEGAPIA